MFRGKQLPDKIEHTCGMQWGMRLCTLLGKWVSNTVEEKPQCCANTVAQDLGEERGEEKEGERKVDGEENPPFPGKKRTVISTGL